MNQISTIFILLHVEEHTLEKVIQVYSRKFDSDITTVINHFIEHQKDSKSQNQHTTAFYESYLEYLKYILFVIRLYI